MFPSPSRHSWRAPQAFYQEVLARWGKPMYMCTDNSMEYAESFKRLCKGMGITHCCITPGNSKGNRQVERIIRTIKEVIRRGLMEHSDSYWMDHLPAALLLLRHTTHTTTRMAPVTCLPGQRPALPSTLLAPLEGELPADADKEQMDQYYNALYAHLECVHQSTGQAIHDSEQWIRKLLREQEAHLVAPSMLFHFQVG